MGLLQEFLRGPLARFGCLPEVLDVKGIGNLMVHRGNTLLIQSTLALF
jgi:hypothetical protein